jgi:Zn finger protein HypA/HybF involved in hydrogenase expression
MARFSCASCDYEAHFVEFKVGEHTELSDPDDETSEEIEVADLECPSCGSEAVYESS